MPEALNRMNEVSVAIEQQTCSACKATKRLDDFPADRRRHSGRGSKCRPCVYEIKRAHLSDQPAKLRERRLKQAEWGRRWFEKNRERMVEKFRSYTLARYGLTQDTYLALLASQGGVCAICRTSEPGRGNSRFVVDHDHRTGLVRGLLCHRCNVGLGSFSDRLDVLERAAAYLGGLQ